MQYSKIKPQVSIQYKSKNPLNFTKGTHECYFFKKNFTVQMTKYIGDLLYQYYTV